MPFDSNDYPLGKEYQARMMRQAHQDHLAEKARTRSVGKVVTGRKQLTFAVVAIILTATFFIGLQHLVL